MPRCGGSKPSGEPCQRIVGASQTYCFAHDPSRKEARRRAASRAAKSKHKGGGGELAGLRGRLLRLGEEVLEGRHDPRRAAVAVQCWHAAIRALELEHRVELDRQTTMTWTDALRLRAHLEDALRKHVKDRKALDAVGREILAIYSDGDPQALAGKLP